MRDIVLTLIVFSTLPFILRKPFVGVLVWTWLGLMNPHRLCWGFAVDFPFAYIVGLTLLISLLVNRREPKEIPWTNISITLAVFWAWMLFTTLFAFNQLDAWTQLEKVSKILLIVFVTMMMLTNRERIDALVWVIVLSLGLYGVKGGIFTLTTGGSYHVMGPARSFIGGNNEIGLALIMTVPLMRYIQLSAKQYWLKVFMVVSMGFTFVAILGTQSRGALVGLVAMVAYLYLKSRRKVVLLLFLLAVLPAGYFFMPQSWHDRMSTIETYKHDESALGRINAWHTAVNVALDRPVTGGGFEMFRPWLFRQYAPDPDNFHDVHSIYFEVLGEHGFFGLALFLGLGLFGIRTSRAIVRETKKIPSLFWMRDLAAMLHVSLIGYAASGAFLGLAYFDFFYVLLAVLVGLQRVLTAYREQAVVRKGAAELPEAHPASAVPAYALQRRKVAPVRGPAVVLRAWYERL